MRTETTVLTDPFYAGPVCTQQSISFPTTTHNGAQSKFNFFLLLRVFLPLLPGRFAHARTLHVDCDFYVSADNTFIPSYLFARFVRVRTGAHRCVHGHTAIKRKNNDDDERGTRGQLNFLMLVYEICR